MNDEDFVRPIILPVLPNAPPAELDDLLARVEADRVRESTSFIFRVVSDFVLPFIGVRARGARESLIRRAGGRPTYLLTHDSTGHNPALLSISAAGVEGIDQPLKHLRQACEQELRTLLHNAGDRCIFQAGHSFHFVTPAGLHVERFIRVADAIRTRDAVETLAFWLQSPISSSDAVLIDTWGIATPVLHAMHTVKRSLPFDCLPSHPRQNLQATRTVVDRIIRQTAVKRLLFIVSITGSGRVIEDVESTLAALRMAVPVLDAISIYAFPATPAGVRSLCRLDATPISYPSEEKCEFCKNESIPLYLESDLYYVKQRQERPVTLSAKIFEAAGGFIAQYGGIRGVLRVHRQDPNDGRHHGFDIDVATLQQESSWLDGFRNTLTKALSGPDVIVAPLHQAADKLVELAHELYPNAAIIRNNDLRSKKMPADESKLLLASKNVLIVDDVLNSGSRLDGYNRSLREDHRDASFATVTYAVGLARPRSVGELNAIIDGLTKKHSWNATVVASDIIFLPHWKKEQCPWCHEAEFLMRVAAKMPEVPEWLDARIAQLSSSDGLVEDPLLILPGTSCPTMGAGSQIASAGWDAMRILYIISTGLEAQRRIEKDSERLGAQFPVANTLSLENWSRRYTEGLFRAMFMRCVGRSEWGETTQQELRREITSNLTHQDQQCIRGEILAALGRNSIQPVSRELFLDLFNDALGSNVEAFANVLGLGAPPEFFGSEVGIPD